MLNNVGHPHTKNYLICEIQLIANTHVKKQLLNDIVI